MRGVMRVTWSWATPLLITMVLLRLVRCEENPLVPACFPSPDPAPAMPLMDVPAGMGADLSAIDSHAARHSSNHSREVGLIWSG
ncbi:unnamed protein product [Gadus morhua 'NCC']